MVEHRANNAGVAGSRPARSIAEIAQLGERQTEDLKVQGSNPCFGIYKFLF